MVYLTEGGRQEVWAGGSKQDASAGRPGPPDIIVVLLALRVWVTRYRCG